MCITVESRPTLSRSLTELNTVDLPRTQWVWKVRRTTYITGPKTIENQKKQSEMEQVKQARKGFRPLSPRWEFLIIYSYYVIDVRT